MQPTTTILVPGFLGSQLRNPVYPVGPQTIWLDPAALALGGFRRLVLAVPTEGIPAPPGPPPSPGHPLPAYYGLLGAYLFARGWRVVSPRMDFRRSVFSDGAALAELVRAEATRNPVAILCHSRGGLVTRAALSLLSASNELGKVARVVGMGVPHIGSLLAVALLGGWHSLLEQIANVGTAVPSFVADLVGISTCKQVVRTWPAGYELLPAPAAASAWGFDPAPLYLPATWSSSTLKPVTAHLQSAAATWLALPAVPAALDWIDVCGVGQYTATGIPDVTKVNERGSLSYTDDGDGVVPFLSAHQSGRKLISTPTQHDMLPNDARLYPHLDATLRNGLAQDLTLSGRVLSL